jgi:hypothetical protein
LIPFFWANKRKEYPPMANRKERCFCGGFYVNPGFARVAEGGDPYEAVERGKPTAKKHKKFYVPLSGLPRRCAARNDGGANRDAL